MPVVDAPGLRPTPDRVRETLFNWLTSAFGGDLDGLQVLDLFAGTGALGLEAASRGARGVVLVEGNARVAQALKATLQMLETDQVEIVEGDALLVGGRLRAAGRAFDVILLDPPFGYGWVDIALPLASALCRPQGYIYVEAEYALNEGTLASLALEIYRSDKAGEVFYHLLRRNIKE